MRCAQGSRGIASRPPGSSGAKRAGARSRRYNELHTARLLLGGELLCLVFLLEGIEQLIELSIHHFL